MSGLKSSIVIRNEFTVKDGSGRGSRGGTPGRYVMNYMARTGAVEDLTPVRLRDMDSYIVRYMAREDAVESNTDVGGVKRDMADAQKLGGIAFGPGDASMSHERLLSSSQEVQALFDGGHTVLKTVLSFDTDYLKAMGCLPEDFEHERRGDFRGNLDQMKLRRAVMHGMDRLSPRRFGDLRYVGVIQVDTDHVHVHLAMADASGRDMGRGVQQRGKLTEVDKRVIRRGIDMYLGEHEAVRQLSSNVSHDKRNAVCFIKKFTHRSMEQQGLPQFLLACLPKDKTLWRAGSNRHEMKKPNYIAREYVTECLEQPGSGYKEALRSIDRYAKRRQRREGLSNREYRRLYKNGRQALLDDCVNAVYGVLRQIPEAGKPVRTPMLSAMSMEYHDMAAEAGSDPMVEFGFKLRSYSTRLDFHKKEKNKYRALNKHFEKEDDAAEQAKPFIDFLRFEEEYQAQLVAKYRHFLSFLPPSDEYEDEFERVAAYRKKLERMRRMRADASARRMLPENAEAYCRDVYGMHGGRFLSTAPDVLEAREALMAARFGAMRDDFASRLADYGLTLKQDDGDGSLHVSREPPYDFDDVKALDLHHLDYDFVTDVPVSKRNVDIFVDAAETRHALIHGAADYLRNTGQGYLVGALPVRDADLMKSVADRIKQTGTLPTAALSSSASGRSRTVRLDTKYQADIDMAIRMSVETTRQFGE